MTEPGSTRPLADADGHDAASAPDPEDTGKIRGRAGFTASGAGIDHDVFLPATAALRVIVIGVDFPDAPADAVPGPDAEVATYHDWLVPGGARWLARSSGGRLHLAADTVARWVRLSRSHEDYGFQRGISTQAHHAYIQEAVARAQDEADLSRYDLVYIVAPRSATGITFSPTWVDHRLHVEAGRHVVRHAVTFGQDMWRWGYKVLDHETGHTLGLPDLYHYRPPGDPPNAHYSVGGWDLMGLISGHAPELLAWQKWRLGWLDDDQVAVVAPGSAMEVRLRPVETQGGRQLAVLPLGPGEALMAECRRPVGNDEGARDQGVLVYRVNAAAGRGEGPSVRILRRGGEPAFAPGDLDAACLRTDLGGAAACRLRDLPTGEEVEVAVLEHGRDGDLVRITRS